MFTLNGKKIKYDAAWTHPETGTQYPANWLRLTSLAEKQAVGLVEVTTPASEVYDQRFYTSANNPKDLDTLKTYWKERQSQIAGSFLAPSDWRIVKAQELGETVPAEWTTYRAAVRSACNTRQTEIDACADVAALKELLFGNEQIEQDGEMVANPNIATAWPAEIA